MLLEPNAVTPGKIFFWMSRENGVLVPALYMKDFLAKKKGGKKQICPVTCLTDGCYST